MGLARVSRRISNVESFKEHISFYFDTSIVRYCNTKHLWIIRVSLKLFLLLRMNRQLLDWPNQTYILSPIRKPGFENFAFLIPSEGTIGEISKIIIFVDLIDNAINIAKYLRSRLSERIWKDRKIEDIICTFSASFSIISRTRFLVDLQLGDTWIWICTEYAGMGINLHDIQRAIHFKISGYIMLPKLLQQLGWGRRDVFSLAVALVFVNT